LSRVFFLVTLKRGQDPVAYERFLREVDYPLTASLLPVRAYRATRVDGRLFGGGSPPYQFLDVIDVEDVAAYRAALESPTPEVRSLLDRVAEWVEESVALYGEVVE